MSHSINVQKTIKVEATKNVHTHTTSP